MKLASLEANFGGGWGLFVYPFLLFYLPLSGRRPNMTETMLTGTLSLNSNKQNDRGLFFFVCTRFTFLSNLVLALKELIHYKTCSRQHWGYLSLKALIFLIITRKEPTQARKYFMIVNLPLFCI